MLVERFAKRKLINPPEWLPNNIHYLADAGSHSYGTHNGDSDRDLFGFCTPPKRMIFPHLYGVIKNFSDQGEDFQRWHEQKECDGTEYDFSVLNIVHFFNLLLKNNPDQVDVLFVNRENIRHITAMGQMVRDARHMFLSKQVYAKYRGYAYSQFNKAEKEKPTGERKLLRDKFGFDPKFLCHCVRLAYECEQILLEGDLDLQRNKDHVKAVKNGLVHLDEVRKWFADKEKSLEKAYRESKLPEYPPEPEIKNLLINCLEHHYGSLKDAIIIEGREIEAIRKVKEILKDFN
jgi:predicted nucleotidyltransferase